LLWATRHIRTQKFVDRHQNSCGPNEVTSPPTGEHNLNFSSQNKKHIAKVARACDFADSKYEYGKTSNFGALFKIIHSSLFETMEHATTASANKNSWQEYQLAFCYDYFAQLEEKGTICIKQYSRSLFWRFGCLRVGGGAARALSVFGLV